MKTEIILKNDIIKSDPARLRQIIINLVSNALKFTRKGYVKINAYNDNLNKKILVFEVVDTGLGMVKQIKEKLFVSFGTYQNDKTNIAGVGLGLCICKSLVSILGPDDSLQVFSEVDIGSTFRFRIFDQQKEIPVSQNPEIESCNIQGSEQVQIEIIRGSIMSKSNKRDSYNEKSLKSNPEYNLSSTLKKFLEKSINIYLVDDITYNIEALEVLLQDYQPIIQNTKIIYSGEHTLIEYVKDEGTDIIFLDVNMPGIGGIKTAREIHRIWSEHPNFQLPFISFVTGYELEDIQEHVCQGNSYLPKPLTSLKMNNEFEKYFQFLKERSRT